MDPGTFDVGGKSYEIYRLDALQAKYDVARLPYSLKILLENLLRNGEDAHAEAVATWDAKAEPSTEIAYRPARVLMQDFTGVPAIVDLAAMRDAMADLGGDPAKINPHVPVELVIDHSIQVDVFAERFAFQRNAELEFERNKERYAFLRWGQTAFDNFAVVPPNTGICHQVNLEYLARVVMTEDGIAYPDTLVGTDSHTTMINGLGVLGWGVGGIEAEAAMLGQPVSMLIPQVVGFRLIGGLPEGSTATDLVLTVTQMLRERGVVGKFVEFFGPGLPNLPLADRATIGNMAPEYGATLRHLPGRRRVPPLPRVLRTAQGAGRAGRGLLQRAGPVPQHGLRGRHLLGHARAGPFHRAAFPGGAAAPQDRVALSDAASDFEAELAELIGDGVEHEPPNGSHEEGVAESFLPAIRPRSPWTEDARASPATGTAAWSPSARGPPSRSATSSSTTAPW